MELILLSSGLLAVTLGIGASPTPAADLEGRFMNGGYYVLPTASKSEKRAMKSRYWIPTENDEGMVEKR